MFPRIQPWITLTLVVATLVGCASPVLVDHATPGSGWPDLASPPVGEADARDDAALIIALDDDQGDRPGAHAVASGWYRYLVETRGLAPRRVQLLRGEDASAGAIAAALERLEARAGAGSMLWLIYIGAASSGAESGAMLRAGDGGEVDFAAIRAALGEGLHESALVIVDACAGAELDGDGDRVSGVSAGPPGRRYQASAQARARRTYYTTSAGAVGDVQRRVEDELRARASTRRNLFVMTAGVGSACADRLDGAPWPALAYAALGGLQGWADVDEDGLVGAVELATFAQSVVADLEAQTPGPARISAAGVDLILADVSGRWRGPGRPTGVGRLAPERLSQTDGALEQAAIELALVDEGMAYVRGGSFWMGCRGREERSLRARELGACEDDERPPRWTSLRGYAIDRSEVRWAEYRACIEAGACAPLALDRCWVWTGEKFERGAELPAELFADDHPVMCVNWLEAQEFCEAVGKRLPTEAEWERAARGDDGRVFPWGDEAPGCEHAVMHGCSTFTQRVGSRPAGASPVGAVDMSGNVSEWVFDWWGKRAYLGGARKNPAGPSRGDVRVVRGGSFYESDANLRAGYRYGIEPLARLSTVGFRCAR